jgi:hypothetical protein
MLKSRQQLLLDILYSEHEKLEGDWHIYDAEFDEYSHGLALIRERRAVLEERLEEVRTTINYTTMITTEDDPS